MKTACYVLVLLLIGAWSAEAAILCARKDREGNASGSLAVRQECRRNEIQLDPDVVGLQAKGPAVYDANNVQVGTLLGTDLSGAQVFFQVGGHPFTFIVHRDYLTSTEPYPVIFETSDCSGMPFIQPLSGGDYFLSFVAIGGTNRTVYLADTTLTPQTIVARSEWGNPPGSSPPAGRYGSRTASSEQAFPATPLVDLDTLFTPPFRVR